MRTVRPGVLGASAALALLCVGISAQQLPNEPRRQFGTSITGAYEGWWENADGSRTFLVGYLNRNSSQAIDVPIGPNNRIEPGGPDMGQPAHFLPGRQWGMFTVTAPKEFTDLALFGTFSASSGSPRLEIEMNFTPLI